jgi:hypothetical protein
MQSSLHSTVTRRGVDETRTDISDSGQQSRAGCFIRRQAPMKIWLTFAVTIIIGSYFLELYLIRDYKPTIELLSHTTSISGELYFVHERRQGLVGEVDGFQLLCAVDFISPNTNCTDLVPGLKTGSEVEVAVVYVQSALRNGYVVMSIIMNGVKVYTSTPEEVLAKYTRSSHSGLYILPFLLFLALVLFPLAAVKS